MDNRIVIVCRHIAKGERPPAFAIRTNPESDADSGWQCLCDRSHETADAMVVSMDEAVHLCPGLEAIKDSPYPCSYSVVDSGEQKRWEKVASGGA